MRSTADGDVPAVLRPLKERAATAGRHAGMVAERRRQRAETVGSLLRSVTSLVIGVLALMLVLGEVGFNLGPFIAGAGVVGVAVGFGAQNVVKDFLSGIFMILEDQYGVGDVVDLGAASGTVEAVGLRVTRRARRQRRRSGTPATARSCGSATRARASRRSPSTCPSRTARTSTRPARRMQAAADELVAEDDVAESVLEEPQLLGVEEIDVERGVVLRLTVKVQPADQWRIARALRQRIADRLDETGIRRGDGTGWTCTPSRPGGERRAAAGRRLRRPAADRSDGLGPRPG